MEQKYAHISSYYFCQENILKYLSIYKKGKFVRVSELREVLVVEDYKIDEEIDNEENDLNEIKMTVYFRYPDSSEKNLIKEIERKNENRKFINKIRLITIKAENLLEKKFTFPTDFIDKKIKEDFVGYSKDQSSVYFGIDNSKDGDCWDASNYMGYRVYSLKLDGSDLVLFIKAIDEL